jgi:hypothetical protein
MFKYLKLFSIFYLMDYIICASSSNDITALYIAYKLLKHDSTLKIGISNLSNDEIDEYELTRFDPDLHKNVAFLLKELGIQQVPFHSYSSPFLAPNYNTLTLEEIHCIETNKDIAPCFALLKYATSKILQEQWDVENDTLKNPFRNARKLWIKTHGKYKNEYLYNMGLWDLLAWELSKAALDYVIQYGTFYHTISSNANAAEMLVYILDILVTLRVRYEKTPLSNFCELAKKLEDVVNIKYRMDPVVAFLKAQDKTIVSMRNEIVMCKDIIFTCNVKQLMNISGFDVSVQSLIQKAIFDMTVIKITSKIENPPWNSLTCPYSNYGTHKIPCRELFYYYEEMNNTGTVVLYADAPFCNYWKFLSIQQIKDHMHKYMQCIFPGYTNFSVIDVAYKTNEIKMWNPGYSSCGESNAVFLQANICSNTTTIEDSLVNANQLLELLL